MNDLKSYSLLLILICKRRTHTGELIRIFKKSNGSCRRLYAPSSAVCHSKIEQFQRIRAKLQRYLLNQKNDSTLMQNEFYIHQLMESIYSTSSSFENCHDNNWVVDIDTVLEVGYRPIRFQLKIQDILGCFLFASFCVRTATSLICGYNKDTDTADCQNKGLTKVPTDLKPSIQHLDLSSNPLKLTEDSFENLTSLITLKMKNLDLRSDSPNEFALHRLEKLEYLDLTGSKFEENFNFFWPKSIKTLIIDNTSFKTPNLKELEHLEKLSAKSCSMESFPSCSDFAPLVCVDLTDNSVDFLHVSHISYYCVLEKLFIKYPASGSELKSKESYCQCLQLLKWAERYSISGMNLECYKGKETDCKVDFTEDVKRHDECTKRIVYEWKRILFEIIIGALAALAVFLLMYVVYRKCIAPFLSADENKPTTKRPLRPSPKPWRKFSLPLRFPATPPPDLPGEEIEMEEEGEEEEDDDDDD